MRMKSVWKVSRPSVTMHNQNAKPSKQAKDVAEKARAQLLITVVGQSETHWTGHITNSQQTLLQFSASMEEHGGWRKPRHCLPSAADLSPLIWKFLIRFICVYSAQFKASTEKSCRWPETLETCCSMWTKCPNSVLWKDKEYLPAPALKVPYY